jgi:hypothetical protein
VVGVRGRGEKLKAESRKLKWGGGWGRRKAESGKLKAES